MSRRPDFFIVGFPKCGTTSLYEYLKGHPDVFMSPAKEPRYFVGPEADGVVSVRDLVYPDDEGRYLNLFVEAGEQRRVGEATSTYVYTDAAAARIRAFAPEARAIILVRDPVKMIHSFHSQRVEDGREEMTDFEQALAHEPAGHRRYYLDSASYSNYVPRWFETLGRDRVHVIVMEDMIADPSSVFEGVLRFLDIDATYKPDFVAHNSRWATRFPLIKRVTRSHLVQWLIWRAMPAVAGEARVRRGVRRYRHSSMARKESKATPMSPAMRAELQRDMEPEAARMGELLGRDLATLWWPPARGAA